MYALISYSLFKKYSNSKFDFFKKRVTIVTKTCDGEDIVFPRPYGIFDVTVPGFFSVTLLLLLLFLP